MAEAILLRNLPEELGEVYVWKKYEVVENISYKWNRWNVVTTTWYKWNKWSYDTNYQWPKYTLGWGYAADHSSRGNSMYNQYYWLASSISMNQTTGYFNSSGFSRTYITTDNYTSLQSMYQAMAGSDGGSFWTGSGDIKSVMHFTTIRGLLSSQNSVDFNYTLYVPSKSGQGTFIEYVTSTSSSAYPSNSEYNGYYYGSRSTVYSKGSTSYGQVTSTSSSAYPSNGVSGSYWYESAGSSTSYSKGSTQYSDVTSTDPNAYPNGSYSGSYWYDNRQEVITHSMGSYIEDVFSTNPQRYPTNGIDGAYWYVLQS